MRAILLRMAERNPLRNNPQAHPPDREPRHACEAGARKGAAVIAANALGQPILGERALEARTGGSIGRGGQRVAAQHEATEAIAQRQRVTVDAITRAKLAFEIVVPTSLTV